MTPTPVRPREGFTSNQHLDEYGFYPRRMCQDVIGNTKCKYRRIKPNILTKEIICVHPLCGEAGRIISYGTNETFRVVGCASFVISDIKPRGDSN